MKTIKSINDALHAIWNPKINILLLKTTKRIFNDPKRIFDDLRFSRQRSPNHLFNVGVITRIPDGFLSCPLLQLNISRPDINFDDMMWNDILHEHLLNYQLYGLIGKAFYSGEKVRFIKFSSVDYTLAVCRTKTLLSVQTKQNSQCCHLEHILPLRG